MISLNCITIFSSSQLNLLSRLTIDWRFQIGGTAGEEISDTGFPIHPAGMQRAIKDASTLNVPMYITEWGIADGIDSRRHQLIGSYINAVGVCSTVLHSPIKEPCIVHHAVFHVTSSITCLQ